MRLTPVPPGAASALDDEDARLPEDRCPRSSELA